MSNLSFLRLFFESWIEIHPKIYYTYVLLDPRKPGKYFYPNINISFLYEPFYDGKGTGNRVLKHLNMKDYTFNNIKNIKIKKIIENNKIPLFIKPAENLYEKDAFLLEKHFIVNIGRIDKKCGPLCNFTDGGEGSSGAIVSEETKKKHSITMKGREIKWKDKISKSEKGKIITPEQKRKISETMKRKIKSGEINLSFLNKTNNEKSKKIISEKSKQMWQLNYEKMRNSIKNNVLKRTKESYITGSNKTRKEYKITNNITNDTFIIKGLAEFCRKNNIPIRLAYQSLKRGHNCKNFRIERIKK